jgi:flavorubredoxin
MNKVFNSKSWETVENSNNNSNLNNLNSSFTENIKLKYLNSIYFDSNVRIDINFKGIIKIFFNEVEYIISNTEEKDKCILIDNWSLKCDSNKINIPENTNSSLELLVNNDTKVNKFTITQNLDVNNCNPNN